MLKKLLFLLPILMLLTGCGYGNGRLRLFNYSFNNPFSASNPQSVTVRKGDTLYSIARTYNVPIRDLIEKNHLSPPYTLHVGRVLRLPGAKFHIVEKGDTLYNISKRYGTDMSSVSRINNLRAPYALSIGQKLVIPGAVVTAENQPSVQKSKTTASSPTKTASTWQAPVKKGSYQPSTYVPPASKYRKNKFEWPVKGRVISPFGAIGKGRNNDGINIKAPLGTDVKAADAGTVAYAGNELKGFGNLILIRHNDGWITAYAHNDRLVVKKGQKVRKGEKIATVGSTGGVNSPQLHFEIRCGKKPLNPLSYLK